MRAKRVDDNQASIVLKLRRMDMAVHVTSSLGSGFPDIVVMDKFDPLRRVYLVEIKDGSKPLSKQKLTVDEQAFAEMWPVEIIRSIEDAACWVAKLRHRRENQSSPIPLRLGA